ncbi:gamma-type small acid-soluble spore protein [Sporosarcina sp. NPDC096371]|uniref:gamma-type small acid-soluble spore protein n=1 Tax=Sporosarcina sp. NPDC096371 TaxID=3364530 RepID=UPI003805AACD
MPNNNNPGKTNANKVQKQNQLSQQNKSYSQMAEEFGSETDVNEVRKQNQQSEANKKNASGSRANQYENGTK